MEVPTASGIPLSIPFHPFLKAAQPHLDKITQQELALILLGLVLPFILLHLLFRRVALPHLRHHMRSFTVQWLLLCAVVHSYLELHFVFFRHGPIANGMDLYAAADFRYGRPLEAGTAAMELITSVIVGPLCCLLVFAIVTARPWRHALQLCLCTAQLYGLTWFILHPFFYHLPVASDDPFLFWVVFVGLNAPWGIFPPILLAKSVRAVSRQFAAQPAATVAPHSNGKKAQ